MGGVFINYRQKDEPYPAAAIYKDLAGHFGAEQVFRDCDSLRPGDDYPSRIRAQLRASKILLVIIGPKWLELRDDNTGARLIDRKNDWVRAEIKDALSLGIFVISVLLDDVDPLSKEDLPEDIAELASKHVCRVHHRTFLADIERLAKIIAELAPEVVIPQLFEKPVTHPACWLPSALLRPEYEVVPLTRRDGDLTSLHDWAISPVSASALLLFSPAGRGKTRLAQQLCKELEDAGWVAGFARERVPAMVFTETSRITKPLLLVIDHAEFRMDQVEAAASMLARRGAASTAPRRVLLLSRHKDWLLGLRQHQDKNIANIFYAMKENPLSVFLPDGGDQEAEFRRATAAFATKLGESTPELGSSQIFPAPRFASVMDLHAAALARLLDHVTATSSAGMEKDAVTRLRIHEYRTWARITNDLDQNKLHVVAAAATLYGAETHQQAYALLSSLPQFSSNNRNTIESYLEWMRTWYAGPYRLNPIEPVVIGEDHLADTLLINPELVTAPATSVNEQQIERAFIVLNRTAVRHRDAASMISALLMTNPDKFLSLAMNALRSCDQVQPLMEAIKTTLKTVTVDSGTLMTVLRQMHPADPSLFPLLYELNRAITGKLAPDIQPDENDPFYQFARQIDTMAEILVGSFANSFAMLNTPLNEGTETQPEGKTDSPPEAATLLRELWRLRNKFQP